MGDDDIARSITLTGQEVIKHANTVIRAFTIDNCKSRGIDVTGWDPITYNDTDSAYISLRRVAEARGIRQTLDGKTVTPEYYALVQETEDHLNVGIKVWGETELGSSDCRLVFKREVIADAGLFLEKKRYILHILDKEGIPCDQFKYTGVEVARTTMPKALKPRVKSIIETMLRTQNKEKTNAILADTYRVFVNLPIEDIASVMGISQYDKYANQSSGFSTALRTPIHVKAAYYYNTLLERYGLAGKYEKIGAGDKIRFFYVAQPNKFGLTVLGYKYQLPPEFKADFRVSHDKMFEKIVFSAISRCYNAVNWDIRLPSMEPQVDLFDLLKED